MNDQTSRFSVFVRKVWRIENGRLGLTMEIRAASDARSGEEEGSVKSSNDRPSDTTEFDKKEPAR